MGIMLEEYAQQMRKEAVEDSEQAWEWVRRKFMEHSDCYEAMKEDAAAAWNMPLTSWKLPLEPARKWSYLSRS